MASAFKHSGARAVAAFALLFCLAGLSGCATLSGGDERQSALDPEADFAIYTARIDRMEYVGAPPCPDGYICMSGLYDLQLTPLEMIAGNPNLGRQTYRVLQHSAYIRNITLLVHAKRDEAGLWSLTDRSIIYAEACLDSADDTIADVLEGTDSEWDSDYDEEEEDLVCFTRLLENER